MSTLKNLQKLLDKNKIKYEIINHKKVFTALDSAQTQHINPKEVVKTLVMKIDPKRHVLALISAKKNLDKEKFLKEVNKRLKSEGEKAAKNIDFAKEIWMKKNIKGKIGATVPLGSLYKMATFIDKELLKQKNLILNSGEYEKSIKIATNKFLKLEDMIKGSFSQAKKKVKIKKK